MNEAASIKCNSLIEKCYAGWFYTYSSHNNYEQDNITYKMRTLHTEVKVEANPLYQVEFINLINRKRLHEPCVILIRSKETISS